MYCGVRIILVGGKTRCTRIKNMVLQCTGFTGSILLKDNAIDIIEGGNEEKANKSYLHVSASLLWLFDKALGLCGKGCVCV